ncbi:hypothetical protein WJX75_005161 [Coccomyxa subellipsoidea]|uniref:HMG box domain-containing protein n=1 Tax=Coccomyxa subellipsoidea TaxID=248742 RepID=A0ABR2YD58_9CHLO
MDWTHHPHQSIYQPAQDPTAMQRGLPTYAQHSQMLQQRAATDAQAGEEAPRVKKRRAKKPKDAPRRPKSAYMFFLAEFREKWKLDHPETQRVSDVGVAAGEAWRSLTPDQKAIYEEQSVASKATYAQEIAEYTVAHPKPPKKRAKPREPGQLRRPTSAYFFFLKTFREAFKKDTPDKVVPVGEMGRLAGVRWTLMSAAEREPYERLSTASKALYARLKTLTPEQRAAQEGEPSQLQEDAAARIDEQGRSSDERLDDIDLNGSATAKPTAQSGSDLAQQQQDGAQNAAHNAAHTCSSEQPASVLAVSNAQASAQALQEAAIEL